MAFYSLLFFSISVALRNVRVFSLLCESVKARLRCRRPLVSRVAVAQLRQLHFLPAGPLSDVVVAVTLSEGMVIESGWWKPKLEPRTSEQETLAAACLCVVETAVELLSTRSLPDLIVKDTSISAIKTDRSNERELLRSIIKLNSYHWTILDPSIEDL